MTGIAKSSLRGAGALAALLACCGLAPGEQLLHPNVRVQRERATEIDDPTKWPASSVGKVSVIWGTGMIGNCTGALVGPRLVLTAAHCLRLSGRTLRPEMTHFVVGMNRGAVAAHSIAAGFETASGAVEAGAQGYGVARADWALIRLKDAIDAKPIPVVALDAEAFAKVAAERSAFEIGFGQERPYLPSIARDCEISKVPAAGEFGHKCLFNFGYSGAPILARLAGGPAIIGVGSQGVVQADRMVSGVACSASEFAAAVERSAGEAGRKAGAGK